MKLLLVDDHAIVREGVIRLLSLSVEAEVVEAKSGREALAVFRAEKPEVVILDLNLPGSGGLDLLRRLLIEDPKVKVLIFSMHTTPLYGAKGYVSKGAGAEELVDAIQQIIAGGKYVEKDLAADLAVSVLGSDESGKPLSARELDIMRLLAKGKGLSDIADALGISYKTVANTCTGIKHKLLVERTSDLIRVAVEMHAA
jgi:DNA-binding NarL/FixJ family response regulator